MTPKKTSAGTYEVRWRVKRGDKETRHKKTFKRRKDAVEFIENLAAERRRDVSKSKRTFGEYADLYLAGLDCKPRTAAGYKSQLVRAREFLGDRAVGTLGASDAQAYLAHLKEAMPTPTYRTRSVQAAWRTFAAVLDLAVEDDAMVKNPARSKTIKPPTANSAGEKKFRPNFLRPQDVANLAAAMPEATPYGLLVQFAAYTGLRRGEVAALDMRHLTLGVSEQPDGSLLWGGSVRVEQTARRKGGEWLFDTPKSERSTREVPLPPWLAEALHDYIDGHPFGDDPNHPLWPGRRKGGFTHGDPEKRAHPDAPNHGSLDWSSRWEPESWCRNVFAPAVTATRGLGHVRFHDLRHTFASICAANGIQANRVSAWMGHATPSFTLDVYTGLFRGEEDALAVQALTAPPKAQPKPSKVTPLHRSA